MHAFAVVTLCLLSCSCWWRDLMELFVGWYSGVEPGISRKVCWRVGVRAVLGIAAAVAALVTL
jgi:hypothetical protein